MRAETTATFVVIRPGDVVGSKALGIVSPLDR
jgi:hypothetical protein